MGKSILFCVLSLVLFSALQAQDIHFSQYNASPLTLNPATTGLFQGDVRFIGNYRSQWSSVSIPFTTLSFSVDKPILKEKTGNDIFGAGLQFYHDKEGDSEFGTTQLNFSLAYNKALNKRANHFISVGVQGGVAQRGINYSNLTFGSQVSENQYDPTLPTNEVFDQTSYFFFDVSYGIYWYYDNTDRFKAYAGYSMAHINKPNQSFYNGENIPLFTRNTVHGGVIINTGGSIDFLPGFLYMQQGPHKQLSLGSFVRGAIGGYGSATGLYFGLWYRANDALIPIIRLDHKNQSIGFSYDINISDLVPASMKRGGPELSVAYILERNKTKAKLFCPQFN